jgi:hypothetical protein
MEYSEDFLKKLVSLGTLNYSIKKIINVLDIEDVEDFTIDFNDKESPVYKAYNKGKDKGEFSLDLKLFELAKAGNLEALKKFELRKLQNAQE